MTSLNTSYKQTKEKQVK